MREDIEKYLENHKYLNLATVDKCNEPWAATLAYVSQGSDVYFMTAEESKKVENIKQNQVVAFTVNDDSADWSNTQAIQMQGEAIILKASDMERITPLFAKKFPQYADMPDGKGFVMIRIKPIKGHFIDSTKGMGFRDETDY